jgi:hypothetical protein
MGSTDAATAKAVPSDARETMLDRYVIDFLSRQVCPGRGCG